MLFTVLIKSETQSSQILTLCFICFSLRIKFCSNSPMVEKKRSYNFLLVRVPPKPHQESSAAQTRTLLTNASFSSSTAATAADLSLCPSFPTQTLPSVVASSSCQENQKRISNFLYALLSSKDYPKVEKGRNESHVSTKLSLSISRSFYDGQNKDKHYVAPNKRKSCPNPPKKAIKRMRGSGRNVEEMQWGYSTDLKLYEDPWKIKKALTESDLGNLSRLLLATDLVEKLVLPVLGVDAQRDAKNLEKGTQIRFWDVDTESMHYLILKHWVSSKSYILIGSWNPEFVKRRCLKKGDEIGLHWDPYKYNFNFSILKRA